MHTFVRSCLAACAFVLPGLAMAACTGADLRETLTPQDKAEIASQVASMPYPEGNHWQATRGDQTIALIGTMHLHDARMGAIVDRLRPTIAGADLLLVEITSDEEAAMLNAIATDPSIAFLTDGPSLIDLVAPDVWTELAAAVQKRGVPPFMAAKYQPWFLSLTLALAPCAAADVQAGKPGLDKQIIGAADAADVPVAGLETFREVFDLMASDPLEEQLRFLPLTIQMERTVNDATATTIASYFEERHGELLAFSQVFTRGQIDIAADEFDALFDEMMGMLLDQRNLMWMDRIDQRTERNIVIAVGAAHLSGETGLLNQLALRGYTVERRPF
ncbi:TraB/GumN family protein [uncultured Tateyamaria sp.]|uniref:TraB/GumN family protein n=1 Tax=uncultured Tateyamaria sp. TaxID=455651 RepID=UPI002606DAA5|nr:TraB/GumN family protein [uncultured Tateyamaria sp.]